MAECGQNKPPSNNGTGDYNMPPLPPLQTNENEGGGVLVKNNGQYCAESTSACRVDNTVGQGTGCGFMMNNDAPGGSWSGGQRVQPLFRRDESSDVGCKPASDSMYNNYGRYSNYSGAGRSSMGVSNFQGDGESINYLAARAHAAQMLAAEESRRLEENLMMLEMRRRMLIEGGGSGMMGGSEIGMSGNQVQVSSGQSSGTSTGCNDSILMARAQKFNMPQSQMNMMDRSSNKSPHQFIMGMDLNLNNSVGNTRSFLQCPNPSNNGPPFAPLNSEVLLSSGEAVAGQISPSRQPTTADSTPKQTKAANVPRRPLSAYNIFFSEMREIILKESDNIDEAGSKEEIKNNATEADRGNTKKPAKKREQTKDMKAFTQNLMKKRLDKKPPKRVHRKSHGKVAFTTLAKTVGQRWRELPQEQKKKYKDLAEIDRARYREEKLAMGKVLREEAKKQRKEEKARQNMITQ